jgi:hypothetical protein
MLQPRRQLWICKFLVLALMVWFVLDFGAISFAQELPPSTSLIPQLVPSRPNFDSSNIPSEKVSQFVNACLQVVALIEQREGELQGAELESESLRIEQEIEAEALTIIETVGLTRQEYLQLLGLANTDPEFGERVAIQLQEATS